MISTPKLIDYYNRAVSDFSHPDPEKAIFGRAQLSGRNAKFDRGGMVGLFGISAKRAAELGWEDLKNPEQNFRAAMDLDISSYNSGDLAEMYIQSAGITGGEKKKSNFIVELDKSFGEIRDKIEYEDGQPVSIRDSEPETGTPTTEILGGLDGKEEITQETKRQSAAMQNQIVASSLAGDSLDDEVNSALNLLREYVDKSI